MKRDQMNRQGRLLGGLTFWQASLFLLLIILLIFFYARQVNFVVADLGRHIVNGKLFVESLTVPSTNFYSYTHPDFPTVTHHWGSGVLYYLIWSIFGFSGLTVFNVLLYLATFLFVFSISKRINGFALTVFLSVLALPLITSRTEIRPEVFSYLFVAFYIWFLYRFKLGLINNWRLYLLPVVQLLWVNLHIFFVMGPFLIGVLLFDQILTNRKREVLQPIATTLAISTLICLLNPFGFHGLIEPFLIFRDYGYMIAENQSIWFMQNRFGKPLYLHVELTMLIGLISIGIVVYKRKLKERFINVVLLLVYGVLAFAMIRNFPLLGFVLIPFAGQNLKCWIDNSRYTVRKRIPQVAIAGFSLLVLVSLSGQASYFSPNYQLMGLGLLPDSNKAARFYKQNNLSGKIFNNYDIGSYLTFHLFPNQKVFVDNRPEAYPVSFFKALYNPMQKSEENWKKADQRFGFNTIFFYRHDMTPHAQPFLIRRIKDPEWAPVYVDNYAIILLKNNSRNQQLIQRFKLPEDMFSSRRN